MQNTVHLLTKSHRIHRSLATGVTYLICLEGSAGGSWTEFGLEVMSALSAESWWSPASPFCFWRAWAMMLATRSLSTWRQKRELDQYNVKWWYFNQRLNWLSLFENLVELWNFHTRWKLNQQISVHEGFLKCRNSALETQEKKTKACLWYNWISD